MCVCVCVCVWSGVLWRCVYTCEVLVKEGGWVKEEWVGEGGWVGG